MKCTFRNPLPAGFSASRLEFGRNVFFRNDMLGWLRNQFGSRYYSEGKPYTYKTGRKIPGRRADGGRCMVDEVRHVPASGCFHDVPSIAALVKMRARVDGEAAVMRTDGTIFWAAVVDGRLVTRTGVAE